jgi:hypothetical protein
MRSNRGCLMVGDSIFTCRHHPGLDQFGAAFQIGENRAGGLFVTATGRYFADDSAPVPILGGVCLRFNLDARLAFLARRHQRLSRLSLRIFPACELLAFARNEFGVGGQRLRECLFEHGSHLV